MYDEVAPTAESGIDSEARKGRYRITRALAPIIPNQIFASPISLAPREILERASSAVQRQANVSAFNEPTRVVLGTDRIGGQLLNGVISTTGTLLLILSWCRGPISAIASATLANLTLPSGVTATHYTGTLSQTVDANLVSAFALLGITHTYAFPGIAYSVFELATTADIGEFHAIIDGVKPYDPRNGAHVLATPSTWTFSKNPALLLAHMISDTTYGLGGTMDWSGSVAAFDACDAVVSGEVKRQIGYTLDRRMPASEVCEILRAHAGCFIVRSAGKYKLVPDAVASSTATYAKSTSTLIEKSVQWQLAGLKQQPNVVEVAYTDTAVVPWRTSEAVYPPNAVPPSGEELRLTRIDLPGCQRYSQAMREVIERRNHARLEPLTITADVFADGIVSEPGDVYTINDGGAFTGTLLRCINRSMRRKGRFTLVGKKYDPATYSSAADAAPTYVNTNLPDPSNPPTVGAITLTEEIVTVPTGALPLSRIRGTWTAVSIAIGYRVVVTDSANVTVDSQDITPNMYVSPPLNAFTTYTVKVYARTSIAVSATASSATISLVSSGVGALLAVFSATIPVAGWTYVNGVESFKLWDGDPYLRIRTARSVEPVETAVYTGANMSTPGAATQTLDAVLGFSVVPPFQPPWMAQSPVFDIGAIRNTVFALLNVAKWTTLYSAAMRVSIYYGTSGITSAYGNGTGTLANARYAQLIIQSIVDTAGGGGVNRSLWQIEFDAATLAALMPTVSDEMTATSSASGPLTVTLPRKYIVANNPIVQPVGATFLTGSPSNLTLSETVANTVDINVFDGTGARVAAPVVIKITGVAA